MVIEKQHMSLDDLLAMGEDANIEIIDWEIIEMPAAGGIHQIISSNISHILNVYVREHDIGVVMPDQMTYLMNSPVSGLKDSFVPDISYISHDNVPDTWDVEKPHPGAPDLAVEIISPNDNPELVKVKVRIYLAQGTKQVWLVYPKAREIEQYTSENPDMIKTYSGSSKIDTGDLFPDIENLTTEAIFKLPKWAVKDETDS